ncbi:MAG: universal stress protein [Cyclobacteriaceae bacterium]
MKKILIPTDFSECAHNALDVAISLAKKFDAELHLYHYLNIPIDWVHLDFAQNTIFPDMSDEKKQAEEQLSTLMSEVEKEGLACSTHINFDNSSDAITRYARAAKIDFIVMGSHGAKGAKELFIGSNAQIVVRNAEIPVLIIKNKMKTFQVPDVLFVSDFTSEMIHPFENVVSFAETMGAKIHLLHINTPSDFKRTWVIEERMESFIAIASKQLGSVKILDSLYFEEGLQHYCQDHLTGVIAIATHHRKGLSRAFVGSLTETIVNHVEVPVMSFPINKPAYYEMV